MNEADLNLANPPIVEAVVEIECDMPPAVDIAALEGPARSAFGSRYPKTQKIFREHHRIEFRVAEPSVHSAQQAIQAFQFRQDDEKQLVQVLAQGFAFNRLAPYSKLDDYLPEIERTWRLFLGFVSPVHVRLVRLRYINRIVLPIVAGQVDLSKYLRTSPRLPDEERLTFLGFLNQHSAEEVGTGHQANIVLASQPVEGDTLPVIFDNSVAAAGPAEPENWPWILGKIQSLRELKNRIFRNTLTELCLNLFQQ